MRLLSLRLKPKGNFTDLALLVKAFVSGVHSKETQTLFQVQVYFYCATLSHFAAFAGHLFLQIGRFVASVPFSNTICLLCVFVSHICNSLHCFTLFHYYFICYDQ